LLARKGKWPIALRGETSLRSSAAPVVDGRGVRPPLWWTSWPRRMSGPFFPRAMRLITGIKGVAVGAVVSLLLRYHGINEPFLHYILGLVTAAIAMHVI
jgi:hypothetical protein